VQLLDPWIWHPIDCIETSVTANLRCVKSLKSEDLSYTTVLTLSIIVQQDATVYSLLYFCKLLYMFRVGTPPIIRSTYNCNYSIWHWSVFGKCSMWSQLKMRGMDRTVSANFLRSRKTAETVGPIPLIFSWLHTLHFPKFDQRQML